jgi:hypothetical protein
VSPFSTHDFVAPVITVTATVLVLIYNNRKIMQQQKVLHAANQATHAAWVKTTDEKLENHGDRLDDHQERFEKMTAASSVLQSKVDGVQASVNTLNHWLQTLLPFLLTGSIRSARFPASEIPLITGPEDTK